MKPWQFITTWTDERAALAKQFQIDGLSASQIATALGGVTRVAVIGKLARMGLGGKYARSRGGEHPPIVRKPREGRRVPGSDIAPRKGPLRTLNHEFFCTEIVELPPDDIATAIEFTALSKNTCRWPIGDSTSLDTIRFCGAKPYSNGKDYPYCLAHCRRAFHVRASA